MATEYAAPIGRATTMTRERVLITGSGAVCGSGMAPNDILAALAAGRSAIRPIEQWDTCGLAGAHLDAEVRDFNPRALVEDRKLHKLIRRTDMLGMYAASQAVDASGIIAQRDVLNAEDAATFSDRSGGLYVGCSGGGALQHPIRIFSADERNPRRHRGIRSRTGQRGESHVKLLRTLPNNVLGHIGIKYNLKGTNACITNHSAGGTLAVIEAAEARCATTRRTA